MPIDLTQFERGASFAGDFAATLHALQERLARLQLAQIACGKSAIIVIEGWQASGRREALRSIAAAWDPCHFDVPAAAGADDGRHWLARYWASLPLPGCTSFYFPSWYDRLLDRRADGSWDMRRSTRGCDEINEFEAQQSDAGSVIVKLFFHLGAATQAERLRRRAEEQRQDPERSGAWAQAIGPDRVEALGEMFAETDTRWAPWRVIDAGDGRASRIAALATVAEALEKALPAQVGAGRDTVVSLHRRAG